MGPVEDMEAYAAVLGTYLASAASASEAARYHACKRQNHSLLWRYHFVNAWDAALSAGHDSWEEMGGRAHGFEGAAGALGT